MSGRYGRVYVGPAPERGYAHPGYRGTLTLDGAWVHLTTEDGEWLYVDEDEGTHAWELVEHDLSIPAAAVDSIEWKPADQT